MKDILSGYRSSLTGLFPYFSCFFYSFRQKPMIIIIFCPLYLMCLLKLEFTNFSITFFPHQFDYEVFQFDFLYDYLVWALLNFLDVEVILSITLENFENYLFK